MPDRSRIKRLQIPRHRRVGVSRPISIRNNGPVLCATLSPRPAGVGIGQAAVPIQGHGALHDVPFDVLRGGSILRMYRASVVYTRLHATGDSARGGCTGFYRRPSVENVTSLYVAKGVFTYAPFLQVPRASGETSATCALPPLSCATVKGFRPRNPRTMRAYLKT